MGRTVKIIRSGVLGIYAAFVKGKAFSVSGGTIVFSLSIIAKVELEVLVMSLGELATIDRLKLVC